MLQPRGRFRDSKCCRHKVVRLQTQIAEFVQNLEMGTPKLNTNLWISPIACILITNILSLLLMHQRVSQPPAEKDGHNGNGWYACRGYSGHLVSAL